MKTWGKRVSGKGNSVISKSNIQINVFSPHIFDLMCGVVGQYHAD